jgi:hypothetical protein
MAVESIPFVCREKKPFQTWGFAEMEVRGTPKSSKIRPFNLESGWLPALESGLSSCFLVIWQY